MSTLETNIYLIKNLAELNCKYRVYKIRGLSPDLEDYEKNIQILVTTVSSITKSPCIDFREGNDVFIAQPDGYKELPNSVNLVRVPVRIEPEPELRDLRFDALDPITARIVQRFLQASLERRFDNNSSLWQPRSGYPFYSKSPDPNFRGLSNVIDLFRGFTFRIVLLGNNGIGVCIDVSSKYVSRFPLPTEISPKDIVKYKGLNCVYEYGNRWYEIRIEGLNDLNASQLPLPNGLSLFDDVHRKAQGIKSQNLLTLPKDCSVLIYKKTNEEQRNVPSGLCRLTFHTDHPNVKRFHSLTIKSPSRRRREIQFVFNRYFRDLAFNSKRIFFSENPLIIENKRFPIPDLGFGNGRNLSVQGSPNSDVISLEELPFKKREILYSPEGGPFIKRKFNDRQYLILPKSILESFGYNLIGDIKKEIQRLFPSHDGISYSPIIIAYNDSVQKSLSNLAREIMKAIDESDAKKGFGLVMIPEIVSRLRRKEDELANLLMCELREKRDLYVTVIHSTTTTESYENISVGNTEPEWKLVPSQQGKYRGYVRNIVLNRILILNSMWPFILKTPLTADLTIGVDVKNNTAGFVLIYKNGSEIIFDWSNTGEKERLSKSHTFTKIQETIRREQKLSRKDIKEIVIHRQGKLFDSEKEGIQKAIKILKNEGTLSKDCRCTFVEVRTTSRVPFRIFEVATPSGIQEDNVNNPVIGTYSSLSENETFVCTTGYPYKYRGSTRPLHVIKVQGELPLESILKDIFYLANLTFTKIDDCSRQPLSVKMNDIRLREVAGEYDRDALKFEEE